MPQAAKKPCKQPGCAAVVDNGYCPAHAHVQAQRRRQYDRDRGNSCERGYDAQWRKLRTLHLNAHPLCVHCRAKGIITAATEVDHITPHRGDFALRIDPANLQSLCKPCHSRKTATEDRGLGHAR